MNHNSNSESLAANTRTCVRFTEHDKEGARIKKEREKVRKKEKHFERVRQKE